MDKVKCSNRVGIDANPHLIAMWQYLQNGWQPPEVCTRVEYAQAKEMAKMTVDSNPYLGFVGIACAFSGSWFAGYSEAEGRNRCAESKRAVLKQIKLMEDVVFIYSNYKSATFIGGNDNTLIYADVPYKGITLYPGANKPFDTDDFWCWAKKQANRGVIVLVSEYTAPEDDLIECIWEQETSVHAHQTNTKKRVEKLFLVKGER